MMTKLNELVEIKIDDRVKVSDICNCLNHLYEYRDLLLNLGHEDVALQVKLDAESLNRFITAIEDYAK